MHAADLPLPEPGASARRERRVIGVVGFAHGVSHFFHLLLAPLFPWLMQEFGLSFTEVGATMTAFFVVSGIGQALAGIAVDRFGARRMLYSGVSCLCAAALALALAHGYAGLVLAAALAGAGNAIFHPADFTLLNQQVSPARLGHAFSVHGLSGNLGWAAAPAFLVGIASLSGWREAALGAAGVAALALAALFVCRQWLASPAPTHADASAAQRDSTRAILGAPMVWLCFGFFLFTTMAFGAFQNFGPPVLRAVYGMGLAGANTAFTSFLLAGAGGMLVGGFMAGRGGSNDRLIAWTLGAGALVALLLATGAPPAASVALFMGAIGFCGGLANPSRDLLIRGVATRRFGKQAFGRVYGFVYSGLDIGLALSPLVFGPLLDHGHFSAVLVGFAVLQALAVLTALAVGRPQRG